MTKKTKAKSLGTKDKKFDFDEEIIIGLKRIEPEEDKPKNLKNKKKSNKQQQKVKQNNKKTGKKEITQKKLTPKQEMEPKKKKAIYRVIKWIMLLFVIVAGTIFALLSPIFNIKTITVSGNSKISTDEIISLSELQLEQNIFNYRQKDVIKKIKENSYIESVKINRKIPDSIEIVVVERKASFMIKLASAYVFINNQGYILEISENKKSLPIIEGIQTIQENIQIGNRLCKEDLIKLNDVLKIMESSHSNNLDKYITQINITDSDNYILTLQKKKKTVHLGDISNLSTKMLWILKFNEIEGNTKGEIILNMNLNDEKNKPYFRKNV